MLKAFAALELAAFAFHGDVGRRRVVSFDRAYDFGREAQRDAPPIRPFLLALRVRVAALAGLAPETLGQALVTEHPPGAAIGWHRDKAVFGDILGVSLGAPACSGCGAGPARPGNARRCASSRGPPTCCREAARTEWGAQHPAHRQAAAFGHLHAPRAA